MTPEHSQTVKPNSSRFTKKILHEYFITLYLSTKAFFYWMKALPFLFPLRKFYTELRAHDEWYTFRDRAETCLLLLFAWKTTFSRRWMVTPNSNNLFPLGDSSAFDLYAQNVYKFWWCALETFAAEAEKIFAAFVFAAFSARREEGNANPSRCSRDKKNQ